ncbi:hexose carrier protein HEX6-like [Diospyros lotus]|uniref:hexose carrier protein HEX6-like n=1 Tax=Diospyros lotus TaxID=55363 RepID=UPI002254D6B6|nr:hexose carrier protein HEX6-like [Diospyros lotus]
MGDPLMLISSSQVGLLSPCLPFPGNLSLSFSLSLSLCEEGESLVEEAMAVGIAIESQGGKQYNGRMTSFVVLSCMMAAMGGVIFGYDIGISGGVTSMASFLKKFFPEVYKKMEEDAKISNYCKFDSQLLTSFTSSLYVAGLIASFFASSITKALGRKPSILIGGAAFLAGAALGGAAFNVLMLIFGRILLGIGVGFANQSVPLYLSEMAPPRYRGAINNGFQFSVGIGALIANLINYGTEKIKAGWGWRISLAMAALPASILTLGALFLPETPNSLIQLSKDREKAKLMLQRIRGTEDVQAEFDDLIKASEISKTIKHPFKKILQRKYRPQLVMAIAIPFFQQVTGINVIAFYCPLLFRTFGLGESASLMSSVVTGVVGTSSTFISMLIVDKLGRRVLLMAGGIQMVISQALVGGLLAAQLGDHGGVSKGYAIVVLVLISVYVAGFGWSWGPLGWLIPSEIFPLEIRSAGQSINVAVNFLFTFIVAQTFLAMLCHFKAGIFFFFGGWVVVMTVFVYLFLPETKNVPIEVMDRVWREHWFWKRIVGEEYEVSKKDEQ